MKAMRVLIVILFMGFMGTQTHGQSLAGNGGGKSVIVMESAVDADLPNTAMLGSGAGNGLFGAETSLGVQGDKAGNGLMGSGTNIVAMFGHKGHGLVGGESSGSLFGTDTGGLTRKVELK